VHVETGNAPLLGGRVLAFEGLECGGDGLGEVEESEEGGDKWYR
jgi:hypothetical protein